VACGSASLGGAPKERSQHWFCVFFSCRLHAHLTLAGAVMAKTAKTKEAQPKDEREDTEAEAEEGTKSAPGKRWFSLKLIAIVAVALIGVGSVGGGAYYFLGSRTEAAPAVKVQPPVFFDMPDILVNLSSNGNGRTQYLKVKVVLELPDQAMETKIQPLMPRVMDMFQTYLRELRATDLDGSAGLYRLKEELTRRVNAAIAPERINAVLFKEIVVQ
jgi:flagellar FliL protein